MTHLGSDNYANVDSIYHIMQTSFSAIKLRFKLNASKYLLLFPFMQSAFTPFSLIYSDFKLNITHGLTLWALLFFAKKD